MRDYAREDAGAMVVMASCVDERFPPENMLDGKDGTFWITTGMYPQEFVLALSKSINVSRITTLTLGVKKLAIERCDQDKPESFDKVIEAELTNRGDRLQSEVHSVNIKAKFLKFTILAGYGEHSTVNRISVLGESPGGEDAGTNEDDGTNYKSGNYGGQLPTQAQLRGSASGRQGSSGGGSGVFGRQGSSGGGAYGQQGMAAERSRGGYGDEEEED